MSKILGNIFSNWANLLVAVLLAFFVSPIIVHELGNELYGVWTLIVSVTGYFTVLDFGVNTAIVRYVSGRVAVKDFSGAGAVYSTAMLIFAIVSVVLLVFSIVFGYFFQEIFQLYSMSHRYLFAVFFIAGTDLATGLLFSVFLGSLAGLQEFRYINAVSILVSLIKNAILVWLLLHGAGLMTLALSQLFSNLVRTLLNFWRLKRRHSYLEFKKKSIDRETVKLIYSYSIYSFIIAVSLKILFYTDSVVIGKMINVSEVTFYAIPSTLMDYLHKFIWSMIAVLIPVISAVDASGREGDNAKLYEIGTRYASFVALPIVISLYFFGDDFITIWMGKEFGWRSQTVLRLLLIGYGFSFTQLLAQGILKGISRHKMLAMILAVEAALNLILSVALAPYYGIDGVAFGTMLPLLLANFAIIGYTCRQLSIPVLHYLWKSYSVVGAGMIAALVVVHFQEISAQSYIEIFLRSGLITVTFLSVALPFGVEQQHRKILAAKFANFGLWGR